MVSGSLWSRFQVFSTLVDVQTEIAPRFEDFLHSLAFAMVSLRLHKLYHNRVYTLWVNADGVHANQSALSALRKLWPMSTEICNYRQRSVSSRERDVRG